MLRSTVVISKPALVRWAAVTPPIAPAPTTAAIGLRGGGKPDLAQGGGADRSGIPAALDALRRALAGA